MQFLLRGLAVLFWKIKSGGVQAGGKGGGGRVGGCLVTEDGGWRKGKEEEWGGDGVCVIDVQRWLR